MAKNIKAFSKETAKAKTKAAGNVKKVKKDLLDKVTREAMDNDPKFPKLLEKANAKPMKHKDRVLLKKKIRPAEKRKAKNVFSDHLFDGMTPRQVKRAKKVPARMEALKEKVADRNEESEKE